jgi:hypothetical protein
LADCEFVTVNVELVAPEIGEPFNCHWYVNVPWPEAVTEKFAVLLAQIVDPTGCEEIVVAGFTVKDALLDVTAPHVPVTTTE